MSPTARLLLVVLPVLGLGLGLALAISARAWSRILALVKTVEELSGRLQALEQPEAESSKSKTAPFPRRNGRPTFRPANPTFRVDPAEPATPPGPTLITIPSLSRPANDSAESAAEDLGRRFGSIWELADSGTAPEAIARTTGQPIGQVELILALRRQVSAGAGGRD